MSLKIAYICLCHMDPDFVGRAAKVFRYESDGFFIHVDNKQDIKPYIEACNGLDNVHFVEDRIDNFWGGYNSIIATMRTMKLALSTDNYDRFVILQGQDYPLFPLKEIHEFFETHRDVEYCKGKNLTTSPQKKDYMKCCGFWLMDLKNPSLPMKCIRGLFHHFNNIGIKYRSGRFKNGKEKWDVYHGSAPVALTRECVEYVLNIYETNERYNKFMKYRFPPDENYIHTIVHNSHFKDKVSDHVIIRRSGQKTLLNLTYCEYPVLATVFTEKEDYQWLINMGCLFVRKVNSTSTALLDEIEKHIL